MNNFILHMIQCKCILPFFKTKDPPVFHHFRVFSTLDNDGSVIPSFAQCTYCNVIHKVTEVGVSKILDKDEMKSLITIDEIRASITLNIVKLLDKYNLDLAAWQAVKHIVENKLWDQGITLSKEEVDQTTVGKFITIVSEDSVKVESFSRDEFVEE